MVGFRGDVVVSGGRRVDVEGHSTVRYSIWPDPLPLYILHVPLFVLNFCPNAIYLKYF